MPSLIGNKPNQVPTNGDLGKLAFQDGVVPAGDIVGTTATQTLTNKTINASQLVDASVTSAKLATQTSIPFATGSLGAGNSSIMKNRIINGAMVIDQRNNGASVTVNAGLAPYTLDRWIARAPSGGGTFTVAQSSTAPVGFKNSLLCTVTSAASVATTDVYFLQQRIEGYNVADLGFGTANAKTVTVSFWVRSSLTGNFGGSIGNNTDQSYPFTFTIDSANTFEQKTITIPGSTSGTWNTTNGTGLLLSFSIGTGSSSVGTANVWANYPFAPTGSTNLITTNGATFYITGVQLEVGSSATGFEYRQYGQELALCQRYYYQHAKGNSVVFGLGALYSNSYVSSYVQFPVTMRATPTLSVTTGTDYYGLYRNSGFDGFNSLSFGGGSPQGGELSNSTEISSTAGQAGFLITNNASSAIAFVSEL